MGLIDELVRIDTIDEKARYEGRVFVTICLVMCSVVPFSLIAVASSPRPLASKTLTASIVLVLWGAHALGLYFGRQARFRAASACVGIGGSVAIFATSVSSGTVHMMLASAAALTLIISPVASSRSLVALTLLDLVLLAAVSFFFDVGYQAEQRVSFTLAISLLIGVVGVVSYYIHLIARRVSEGMRRSSQEARLAIEQAERANDDRRRYLANMSHELRTPVHAITGYAELVLEELEDVRVPDEELVREDLERIREASQRLLEIIGDILDLSKLEAGKLELEPVPFDPAQLLEENLERWRALASARSNELVVELGGAPRRLVADPSRLLQVMENLVSNAAKFTESGTITLRVETRDGRVRFDVEDTGRGIDERALARLLSPLSRVGSSSDGVGAGIGLAVGSLLAEAMAGTLEASSVPDEGSTFSLCLPLEREDS